MTRLQLSLKFLLPAFALFCLGPGCQQDSSHNERATADQPQDGNSAPLTKEQTFWKWFVAHEQDLMHFERNQEAIFDQLSKQLENVHPDLTFEFGPVEEGRRDFVISAAGIKDAFPAVQSLTAAKPPLEQWIVIAFRPRRPVTHKVAFGGHEIDPKDVKFTLLRGENELGLYLFLPGYTDNNSSLKQIGYLLLDGALGEYDVETKVGLIEMYAPEAETAGPRYPLENLAKHFDEAYASLSDAK